MTRLIVLTFAFLAWAFYEMSDGADFEPRGVRPPKPENVAAAPAPKPEPRALTFETSPEKLVFKAALGPAKTLTVPPGQNAQGNEDTKPKGQAIFSLAQMSAGLNADQAVGAENTTKITLISMEQGAAGLQQEDMVADTDQEVEPAYAEPVKDIRQVTGTRVNMRNGPGTIYPVIAKLGMGHQVEVLDDPGIGWLRLRVLPEQQLGWIAASLVSKKTN